MEIDKKINADNMTLKNKKMNMNSSNSLAALVRDENLPSICLTLERPKERERVQRSVSESSTASEYSHRTVSESSDVDLVDGKHKTAHICCHTYLQRIAISILLLLTVVLSGLVIKLTISLEDVKDSLSSEIAQRQLQASTLCLPCVDLELGPFPEDNPKIQLLDRKAQNGVEQCCSRNSDETSLILDLFTERKQKITSTKELIQSHQTSQGRNNTSESMNKASEGHVDVISAHLLAGFQMPSNNKGSGPTAVRNWSVIDPVAHVHGLTIMNDRIRVNTSGLYFVYSQVYFVSYRSQRIHNATMSSHALYHFVYRYNVIYPNGGEELLLKGIRTKCWSPIKDFDDHTSYTAAALHLNANDEIYVKVSNISSISRDSKATFLGLFKIS